MEKEFIVKAGREGERLDSLLAAEISDLSRSGAQRLIANGLVLINGEPCLDKNYRVRSGELIITEIPEPEEAVAVAEDIPLSIIYEDEDLVVINKPRGMVVHPAPGHSSGTLVNALLNHCSDLSGIGGVIRPGIVHRLDKDTSGLLLAAKNDFTHKALSAALKERLIKREYLALVTGRVAPLRGRIDAPVGRHPRHRKKMAVLVGGREAVTRYRVIKYYRGYTLLELNLETGRTHQIRVHMAYLGHPVAGDQTYGGAAKPWLPAELTVPHALHARKLGFPHPRSGKMMHFKAPLPPEFKKGLTLLAREG